VDFQFVLADLISGVEGAVGVLLLDWDGETVEALGCTGSIHDIKVLGAYQGIFLTRAKGLSRGLDLGECREFTIRLGGNRFMTRVLPEGYYLTLIIGEEAVEGTARRCLDRAAIRVEKILF
jgi:predicted regulator of Ras-like GTPase activity (Roadblock/LC7/MglB family)